MDHLFLVALGYFGHNCSEVISILLEHLRFFVCSKSLPSGLSDLVTFGRCREGRLEGKALES